MFPPRLLRGIDLAIAFATLGEYGLEPVAEAPAAVPAFRVDLSRIGGSDPASPRLAPATAAARRLHGAGDARVVAQPRMRRRGGAARPRPQPCLVAEGRPMASRRDRRENQNTRCA